MRWMWMVCVLGVWVRISATEASLESYPPDKTISQSIRIGDKTLNYHVTVGVVPVRDGSLRPIGAVSFVAYVLEAPSKRSRPVTFAMNGGPGVASAAVNVRALGPKRLVFDTQGSVTWVENPASWLSFTDLVFLDAMDTGFSRSFLEPSESRTAFLHYDSDIAYLSQAIFDWLQRYGRLQSQKHLVGESYSGYRAPRILEYLQTRLGTPFDGLVLLSPLMNQDQSKDLDVLPNPVPWIGTLPTAVAAQLERNGQLSAAALAPIEQYARSEYATALLDGWRHPEKLQQLVSRLIPMTGLSEDYLLRTGGRIEPHSYLREIYHFGNRFANYYDVNITYPNGFPVPNDDGTVFEILTDNSVPAGTPALTSFITDVVGWKPAGRYVGFSRDVNEAFVWARGTNDHESYSALRRLLLENPRLKVLLTHGYTDIACPYFADVIALDQIPPGAGRDRIRLSVYPGGHAFYTRTPSLEAFTRDARANY